MIAVAEGQKMYGLAIDPAVLATAETFPSEEQSRVPTPAAAPFVLTLPPMGGLPRQTKALTKAQLNIKTAASFISDAKPIRWVVKGLFQRQRISTMTGASGAGKTSIAILMAVCVATGTDFAGCKTKKQNVLFMSGENPDDVKSRMLGLIGFNSSLDLSNLYFREGTFDIEANIAVLTEALAEIGEVGLIIVDTLAAFNTMDDENDAKMGRFVHAMRPLLEIAGNPAVLVLAHPPFTATRDNLRPRGSSAILAEIDCNYCVFQKDHVAKVVELFPDTQKFRGTPFDPIEFKLTAASHPSLVDEDGDRVSTVIACPVGVEEAETKNEENISAKDKILCYVAEHPDAGRAEICEKASVVEKTAERLIPQLVADKFLSVPRDAGKIKQYRLTKKGKDHVEAFLNREKKL